MWKWVWRPTALDTTRDKLFDLRDNVLRQYFIERKIPLDHPIYVRLRALLNGHLRHTESITIWELTYLNNTVEKDEKLNARFAEMNRRLQSDDPELQSLIDEVRLKSTIAMIAHMIETSMAAMLIAIILMPLVLIHQLSWKAIVSTRLAAKTRVIMEKFALAA